MSKASSFQAILNLRTGEIYKLHDGNRNLLQRKDMREIEAKLNKAGNAFEEIKGSDEHAAIASSADLYRIAERIIDLSEKRQQLIEKAMGLSGGEEYLLANKLIEPGQTAKIEQPLEESSIEYPEGEGMMDVTEQLANGQKKSARKSTRKPASKPEKKEEDQKQESSKEPEAKLDGDFDI